MATIPFDLRMKFEPQTEKAPRRLVVKREMVRLRQLSTTNLGAELGAGFATEKKWFGP
jgi:hypothetical protein